MEDAGGASHLYPVAPIMNFVSMILLLLIIPGFWKTRIVALVALVGWIFVANLTTFLGMVHWRGHTNDAPVWASILVVIGVIASRGFVISLACFAHFTWQRLQPLSIRKLYDNRRRDNLIHLFLTLILPVLWTPLYLLSFPFRYVLIEDLGPFMSSRMDWPGFLVTRLPPLLSYAAVGIFNVLALVRHWYGKQEDIDTEPMGHHPSVRTRKLLLMAVVNIPLAAYGFCNQFASWGSDEWTTPQSLAENISSLQIVLTATRSELDARFKTTVRARAVAAIAEPLVGFYVFVCFGLGAEARRTYVDGLLKFGHLIAVAGTIPVSWSAKALSKVKSQKGGVVPLPLLQPTSPQIIPYISQLPRECEPRLPASPTRSPRSNHIVDVTGGKRVVPPKEPACRQSHHKPALTTLEAAHAIRNTIALEPNPDTHGLLASQPISVPLDPPNASTFEPSSLIRRLFQHKPAFVPLAATNVITNATPEPSGSNSQHVEDENNARRQAKFAPRPLARRISYHKPVFVPLVHANHRGEILDAGGASIPLMEVRIEPANSEGPELPEDGAVDDGEISPLASSNPPTYLDPPLRSSRSGFMAPSSLSSQGTPTPAPPYQDLNPFPNGTP